MGEVYAALDESLERSVALKILPPGLVRSEDRVRRFIAEARSASSLNHPNIVTIYEIGEATVRAAGRGPEGGEAASIRYISMELVTGKTLTDLIHDQAEDLRTLVGYIAQAAEGVARAHVSGIVHRDLKPGNIMVSTDGIVKVLDFGLAKLTEKRAASTDDRSSAPTEVANTREGTVMGTVGYMSPEQVAGKVADSRSDIFSMGCILYEAATRRRPFVADTDVEVMHQILRERPVPVEELNAAVPGDLRRLIRRCLAKQPDERLQSMKDLAIDLREVAERWDSLPLPSGALSAPPPRRRGITPALAAILVLASLGAAGGLYALLPRGAPPAAPDRSLRRTILMTRNDLVESVLSGDGRYLAYVTTMGDLSALNVRQVRTGSEVQILSQPFPMGGISFSPDGDYLYFLNRDPKLPNYHALFQVASLGGSPRKIVFNVDTAVSMSPDGKQLCFRRGLLDDGADSLVIFDTQTGQERELIRVKDPESFAGPGGGGTPAWSPDGKRIAVPIFNAAGGAHTQVVTIDAQSGEKTPVGPKTWLFVNSLGWVPDGSAIMMSAYVIGTTANQIYRLSFPDGDVRRTTSDLDGYDNLSLSTDGKVIAAVRRTGVANIWVAPLGTGGEPRSITAGSGGTSSLEYIQPLADGGVAFSAGLGERVFLWRIEPDGTGRRQLSTEGIYVQSLCYAEPAGLVFTQVSDEAILHLWRVNPDGSGLKQLTDGSGEILLDVSPDGTTALFVRFDNLSRVLSLSLAGGEPRFVLPLQSSEAPLFSPDSRRLLYTGLEKTEGSLYPKRIVVPAVGGDPLGSFLLPPGAIDLKWAPDGEALTYVDRDTGFNLMRRPIAREATDQLTHFKEGRIKGHEWSPDGRKVLMHRRLGQQDSLWVFEPGASRQPSRLADFRTGQIFRYAWARDSRSAVFTYGETSQDVVLLSDYQ